MKYKNIYNVSILLINFVYIFGCSTEYNGKIIYKKWNRQVIQQNLSKQIKETEWYSIAHSDNSQYISSYTNTDYFLNIDGELEVETTTIYRYKSWDNFKTYETSGSVEEPFYANVPLLITNESRYIYKEFYYFYLKDVDKQISCNYTNFVQFHPENIVHAIYQNNHISKIELYKPEEIESFEY